MDKGVPMPLVLVDDTKDVLPSPSGNLTLLFKMAIYS